MNKYLLRIGNAKIECEGLSEYAAIQNLALFNIGDLQQAITGADKKTLWVYQIEVKGQLQIATIERI